MEWSDFLKYFDLVYICHPALETILNIPVTCRAVTTVTPGTCQLQADLLFTTSCHGSWAPQETSPAGTASDKQAQVSRCRRCPFLTQNI